MAKNSHSLSYFRSFLTCFFRFFAVSDTVMLTLGAFSTWTFLTHVGSRFQAILGPLSHTSMAGGGLKMGLLMAKIAHNGKLVPGQRNPPGNWLMGHITSQSIEKHYIWPFKPSSGTYPWQSGLKNALFYDKSSPKWAPNGPYHITIHEKTLLKYTWSKIIVANI